MKEDERYIERRKKERRVTSVMKRSLYLVFFVILVFSGFLIGRLVYLNNVNGDRYAKAVLSQQSYTSSVIKAERGKIYDRNGIILARSEKKYNMVIDPAVILSKDYYVKPTLTALEEIFGYPPEVIRELIDDNPKSLIQRFRPSIHIKAHINLSSASGLRRNSKGFILIQRLLLM